MQKKIVKSQYEFLKALLGLTPEQGSKVLDSMEIVFLSGRISGMQEMREIDKGGDIDWNQIDGINRTAEDLRI